ncbi:unnamed protein product [Gordionus sp. m RMFG-2023]
MNNFSCSIRSFDLRTVDVKNKVEYWDPYCWLCHLLISNDAATIIEKGPLSNNFNCHTCQRSYHRRCLNAVKDFSLSTSCHYDNRLCVIILICPECQLLDKEPKCMEYFPKDPKYIVKPMNFNNIESNIQLRNYTSPQSSISDIKYFYHNIAIYYGMKESHKTPEIQKIFTTLKRIENIFKDEVNKIQSCPECYYNAQTLPYTHWFTAACGSCHILVWAKLKGYPLWPGKVMRIRQLNNTIDTTNNLNSGELNNAFSNSNDASCSIPIANIINLEVRFFGKHHKYWLPLQSCFLLSKQPPSSINTIIPASIRKEYDEALNELDRHIVNLEDKFEVCFPYANDNTLFPVFLPNTFQNEEKYDINQNLKYLYHEFIKCINDNPCNNRRKYFNPVKKFNKFKKYKKFCQRMNKFGKYGKFENQRAPYLTLSYIKNMVDKRNLFEKSQKTLMVDNTDVSNSNPNDNYKYGHKKKNEDIIKDILGKDVLMRSIAKSGTKSFSNSIHQLLINIKPAINSSYSGKDFTLNGMKDSPISNRDNNNTVVDLNNVLLEFGPEKVSNFDDLDTYACDLIETMDVNINEDKCNLEKSGKENVTISTQNSVESSVKEVMMDDDLNITLPKSGMTTKEVKDGLVKAYYIKMDSSLLDPINISFNIETFTIDHVLKALEQKENPITKDIRESLKEYAHEKYMFPGSEHVPSNIANLKHSDYTKIEEPISQKDKVEGTINESDSGKLLIPSLITKDIEKNESSDTMLPAEDLISKFRCHNEELKITSEAINAEEANILSPHSIETNITQLSNKNLQANKENLIHTPNTCPNPIILSSSMPNGIFTHNSETRLPQATTILNIISLRSSSTKEEQRVNYDINDVLSQKFTKTVLNANILNDNVTNSLDSNINNFEKSQATKNDIAGDKNNSGKVSEGKNVESINEIPTCSKHYDSSEQIGYGKSILSSLNHYKKSLNINIKKSTCYENASLPSIPLDYGIKCTVLDKTNAVCLPSTVNNINIVSYSENIDVVDAGKSYVIIADDATKNDTIADTNIKRKINQLQTMTSDFSIKSARSKSNKKNTVNGRTGSSEVKDIIDIQNKSFTIYNENIDNNNLESCKSIQNTKNILIKNVKKKMIAESFKGLDSFSLEPSLSLPNSVAENSNVSNELLNNMPVENDNNIPLLSALISTDSSELISKKNLKRKRSGEGIDPSKKSVISESVGNGCTFSPNSLSMDNHNNHVSTSTNSLLINPLNTNDTFKMSNNPSISNLTDNDNVDNLDYDADVQILDVIINNISAFLTGNYSDLDELNLLERKRRLVIKREILSDNQPNTFNQRIINEQMESLNDLDIDASRQISKSVTVSKLKNITDEHNGNNNEDELTTFDNRLNMEPLMKSIEVTIKDYIKKHRAIINDNNVLTAINDELTPILNLTLLAENVDQIQKTPILTATKNIGNNCQIIIPAASTINTNSEQLSNLSENSNITYNPNNYIKASGKNNRNHLDKQAIKEIMVKIHYHYKTQLEDQSKRFNLIHDGLKLHYELEKENLKKIHKNKLDALQRLIHENKKKQWCLNCFMEANFYCCIGIWYCSITCQGAHWKIHKEYCAEFKMKMATSVNPLILLETINNEYKSLNNNVINTMILNLNHNFNNPPSYLHVNHNSRPQLYKNNYSLPYNNKINANNWDYDLRNMLLYPANTHF